MQLFDDDFIAIASSIKSDDVRQLTPIAQTNELSALDTSSILKACLFTLIVYSKDFEQYTRSQKIIRLISKKCPCKILFVHIDGSAKDLFQKEHIFFKNSSQTASNSMSELISFQISQDQLHKMPFSLLPEIAPDLPVYSFVADSPKEHEHIFTMLMPYLQKIVFDPIHINNYSHFSQEILSSTHFEKYIDINWLKIKPWREAIWRIFEEKIDHIKYASNITIRYSKSPISSENVTLNTQAIYLQSWLSVSLDFTLSHIKKSEEGLHLFYKSGSSALEIDIIQYDCSFLEEGSVISIEINGINNTHYLIGHESDDRHIVVHSSSSDRCEMPFVLFVGSFQRGHIIIDELFRSLNSSSRYSLMLKELMSQRMAIKE